MLSSTVTQPWGLSLQGAALPQGRWASSRPRRHQKSFIMPASVKYVCFWYTRCQTHKSNRNVCGPWRKHLVERNFGKIAMDRCVPLNPRLHGKHPGWKFFLQLSGNKASADWLSSFLEPRWYFPWHFSPGCCRLAADPFHPAWKARPRSLLSQLSAASASFNGCRLERSIAATSCSWVTPSTSCHSPSNLVFIFPRPFLFASWLYLLHFLHTFTKFLSFMPRFLTSSLLSLHFLKQLLSSHPVSLSLAPRLLSFFTSLEILTIPLPFWFKIRWMK